MKMNDKPPSCDTCTGGMNIGYGSENAPLDHAFRAVAEARPPRARTGKRLTVCAASEIPIGGRRIVQDGALSIGVFNIAGQFFAIKNVCPHYGAELCRGSIHATHAPSEVHEFNPVLHDRVIRCPWHGWEFDIVSGKGLYDHNSRVATYVVEIDDQGDVVITL